MCYETSLTKKVEVIEENYEARMFIPELYKPWYHKSGFVNPNMFCIPMEDPQHIYPMEWGLIAPWGDKDIESFRLKYNTLNAKSETVLKSPMYKNATRERRCLIIADGFFEPHHAGGNATPYYCYLDGRKLFTFAGIYNEIESDYWTVSLLTTEANPFFAEVHNKKKRMPLVLDTDFEGEWLNPGLNDTNLRELMANAFTKDKFNAHPVTRDIYKRDINTNTPRVLEKVDDNPQDLFSNG